MNHNLHFWTLVGALAAVSIVSGSKAQAAITGKIGVGTWDTQAEFASVKVLKGTTTLYQSNFNSNQNGWTTSGGTWSRQNGYFRQTGSGAPAMAWVGNTSWTDYTLTLKARKISGNEGFLITFGAPGDVNNYWWNIGGWGNTKHAIQMPGVQAPEVAGSVTNNVWYDIKVQLSGDNIKCYLNGALIHNTIRAHVMDAAERSSRIQQILNSPGYQLLTPIEKTSLQELFSRNVYLGFAATDTFSAMPSSTDFAALTAQAQLGIIRKVGAKRVTWNTGGGFGSNLNTDQEIISSVDRAVMMYNSVGVFDKHIIANNSPGTPTADCNYDGWMNFGGSRNYRVALHEMGHAMGVGTYWNWRDFFAKGVWTGMYGNAQVKQFDGPNAIINDGGVHFWPYGLNYDNELSGDNDRRHVIMIAAMRRDMGIASTLWMPTTTSVPNGTYRLVPRNATFASLDVASANNSASISINNYTGAASQKFLVDLQSDGTYRIRTNLMGNRCVELPGGVTDNGTKIKLWDDNGNNAQRWYFIPMGDGWYKIAPKTDMGKGIDLDGGVSATANGTLAQSWDYLDGANQQWKFAPTTAPTYSTGIANGTYRITPRHATGSSMEVLNSNSANNGQIDIRSYSGNTNQQFLFDLQSDGSYTIRTSLTDNRLLDLPSSSTSNGNKLVIYDNTNSNNQRWYLIPTDNGWYKIVPKIDMDNKCVDVEAGSNADGSLVQNWDYLGTTNQQWQFTAATASAPTATTTNLAATPNSSVDNS